MIVFYARCQRDVYQIFLCVSLKTTNEKKKKPRDVRNKAIIIIPLASHIHPRVAFNKWQGPGGEYICYVTVFSSLQSEMTGKWDNCSLHRYFFSHYFFPKGLGPPTVGAWQVLSVGILCHCSPLNETTEGTACHSAWVLMWLGQ